MSRKNKQNIVIAIVSAVVVGLGVFLVVGKVTTDNATKNEPSEIMTLDVDSTEIDTEDTLEDDADTSYVDVGYEKTETATTVEEQTGLTEEDLAKNEFLVNEIIFTYTGGAEDYKISKGASDADFIVIRDGEEVNCYIEVVSSEMHQDEVKRIATEGEPYVDVDGNYFYVDFDMDVKTVVSIKYQKYITIKCEDASIFDELELRSSNLNCC